MLDLFVPEILAQVLVNILTHTIERFICETLCLDKK